MQTSLYQSDGDTVTYAYDVLGRRIVMTDSLGVTVFGYDELSRLTVITDSLGATLHYAYDVMHDAFHADAPQKAILVGDPNIAPREDDVWSHKQLLKIVSHTPIEVDHLGAAQEAGRWVDITRQDIPSGLLYSWWSYRAADWDVADKGRRLDHIWATPDISNAGHGSRILRAARGWEQPSDHAPVFASFDL